MRIGPLRLRWVLRALALAAALLGAARVPAAVLASCATTPAAPHGCCGAVESSECPSEGAMPCCQVTRPEPASPSLLTAAGAPAALAASADLISESSRPSPASPAAPRATARSSPLFLAHSALLI